MAAAMGMRKIWRVGRVASVMIAVTLACSSERPRPRGSSRLELAIERELGARVGVPVLVRCAWIGLGCRATLPDRSHLDLRLAVTTGALGWRLDGALVLADDIEQYLRDALEDLGKPQGVRCGARIRTVAAGERMQCQLQNGGKAFVVVNGDGTTSTEIVLDPAAGEARGEPVTIERDSALREMSKKLEHADEEPED